jgi:hypothetical protein
MMNIKSITPKFVRRIFVLREYRITKAIIKNLKTDRIPNFEDFLRNPSPNMLRPKTFYEAMVKYYHESLIQNEGRLEDLQHEMRELGIPLE